MTEPEATPSTAPTSAPDGSGSSAPGMPSIPMAPSSPAPAETPVRARGRTLPSPGARRATVIGAGSFGTALAVLLSRAGLRTTLQTRSSEQATLLADERENKLYLPGVELPSQLRVEAVSAGVARADYVFLAVPSRGLGQAIAALQAGE
ncbi:MAG TPA: 2-dehydropantoate 2-reductase N-terminal domain-containing protein, partial [Solirubrobacteraceae bacterium]|nr:2-dehydropantoate 2-reductase N-terminal domain-containing protein [Solirubrobacteraceae bacterium]